MNKGKILLVGFGPGAPEHMSQRALDAIAEADVVIGYSTYIKLVQHLLDGKEVIRKGMTEELDRSIEAYEQACLGKTVALVSSGDIGVYGMAGPTYEVLFQAGWTPDSDISVEVIPGATALNACAALVGAPLTHDFCSISLSDLLTPWPTIARRLQAAAKADFVVGLYNPKSGRRTQQIVEAQRIMLLHRRPDTPVAIVKSGYRRRQAIQMTTLAQMADCEIGMLCTVLIGNSSTFVREGLMVTPRGYANKYDTLSGETKNGEQAGRSLSMGLTGWHACVRRHIIEHPEMNLRDVAGHFDAPLGEILAAIAEDREQGLAGTMQTRQIAQEKLEDVLAVANHWGRLRAVVRSQGAIAEILLEAHNLTRKNTWLNLTNEHCHLHIDTACIADAWFFSQGDKQQGMYLLDAQGEAICSLLLVKTDGHFDETARQCFQQAIEQFGQTPEFAEETILEPEKEYE